MLSYLGLTLCCGLLLCQKATGYLLGDETLTWCWRKDLATGIQELLDTCPEGVDSEWIETVPAELYETTPYDVSYRIHVPATYAITSVPEILHTNLHSCTVTSGSCTPNVAETPGLVTHNSAQTVDLSPDPSDGNLKTAEVYEELLLEQ